jgi:hypothetical protein
VGEANNIKNILLRILLVLVLVLSFSLIIATPAQAAPVNITKATGGGAISADTAADAAVPSWTNLGPISINETAVDDIAAGQNGVTLILSIPAGFEFNDGQVPDITGLAGDITALGRTISSSNITVTFTTDGLADVTDNITIGAVTAIQVRPTHGTPLATGNITRHADSTSNINGIDATTNFGTLTEVVGAIDSLTIIQQPTDTMVNANITPAVTVRATDQFTNNVSGQNIAVALQAGTGALTGTSPQVTNANGIATFGDLKINTTGFGKQLRFSFGGVTVDSNTFSIFDQQGTSQIPPPPPVGGVTDISNIVTGEGLFTQGVTVSSGDNNVQLTVDQGTTGQSANGQPLSQLVILQLNFPPDPPEQSHIIGLTYDFRPDGATFDQPVTITFTYDPNNLPAGVNEEDLSIAFYDDINGEWVELQNIVLDPLTHTITGQTKHFTPFAVMALTEPASFAVSSLTLTPSEIYAGETSTVSVTVTNNGDLSGTYSVVLKIDDAVMETKQVTLDGNQSQTVDFSVSLDTAGTYNIVIGSLSGVLTITEPTPTPAPTQTQEPTPTATETSAPPPTQEISPSPTQTATPSPTTTPAPTTTPPQSAAPTPSLAEESGTNWGMIGGIIGGVIVVAIILGFWITHRRD